MDTPIPDPKGKEHIDRHLGIRDSDIVAGIVSGDVYVMEKLFHVYFPILVRFAQYRIRALDVAEEVVAELFCWIWEKRSSWSPRGTVESYLFAAVWNRIQNVRRNENRMMNRHKLLGDAGYSPALGSGYEDGESRLLAEDNIMLVNKLLDSLPERTRVILRLRWHNDLKFEEISEIMGISQDSVKKIHQRALLQLRKMFSREFF